MLEELQQITDLLEKADNLVSEVVSENARKIGVSRELVEEKVNKMLAKGTP